MAEYEVVLVSSDGRRLGLGRCGLFHFFLFREVIQSLLKSSLRSLRSRRSHLLSLFLF